MGHFEDLEDLGLKTSVSVLGIRPGLRSELKTLDRLAPAQVVRVYKSLFTERRGGSTYQFRQTVNQPDTNRQTNRLTDADGPGNPAARHQARRFVCSSRRRRRRSSFGPNETSSEIKSRREIRASERSGVGVGQD